ncbi:MAG: hypothetical protein MI757_18015 [Pirellulales bacterium]|nr:hypothetical protein [Pirellulales bacterium]
MIDNISIGGLFKTDVDLSLQTNAILQEPNRFTNRIVRSREMLIGDETIDKSLLIG